MSTRAQKNNLQKGRSPERLLPEDRVSTRVFFGAIVLVAAGCAWVHGCDLAFGEQLRHFAYVGFGGI